jgi:hypothetical protein
MQAAWNEAHALPFEIWREDGVIHLLLTHSSRIDAPVIKEILRVIGAVDPGGRSPVLVEQEDRAVLEEGARSLLHRVHHRPSRPVAFVANDLADRTAGELLGRYFHDRFPFRTFAWKVDALHWVGAWLRSPGLRVVR